jgi:hypothetical protein
MAFQAFEPLPRSRNPLMIPVAASSFSDGGKKNNLLLRSLSEELL